MIGEDEVVDGVGVILHALSKLSFRRCPLQACAVDFPSSDWRGCGSCGSADSVGESRSGSSRSGSVATPGFDCPPRRLERFEIVVDFAPVVVRVSVVTSGTAVVVRRRIRSSPRFESELPAADYSVASSRVKYSGGLVGGGNRSGAVEDERLHGETMALRACGGGGAGRKRVSVERARVCSSRRVERRKGECGERPRRRGRERVRYPPRRGSHSVLTALVRRPLRFGRRRAKLEFVFRFAPLARALISEARIAARQR